jgi:hypothetical protein
MPWHLKSLSKTVVILVSSLCLGNSAVPLGIDFHDTDFMNMSASPPLPYELASRATDLLPAPTRARRNSFKLLRPK